MSVYYGATGKLTKKGKKLKEKATTGNLNRWNIRLATIEKDGDTIVGDSKSDILAKGNIANKLYVERKKAGKNKPAGNAGNVVAVKQKESFNTLRFLNESLGELAPRVSNQMDLGSTNNQFKDLYVDGTAHLDAIDTGGLNGRIGLSTANSANFLNITATSGDFSLDVDIAGDLDVTGDIDCDDIECDNFTANSGYIEQITKAQGYMSRNFALNSITQDVSYGQIFLTNATLPTNIRTFTNAKDFQIITVI